jgi:hypothetical protein
MINIDSINRKESDLNNLYVITAIFNPAAYKKRYDLYYQFESHLKKFGINLITIECIYNENPNSEFCVTDSNNPFHIQVRTDHPLWHKENLLNLAISKLPDNWKYVLWLDADIEFIEDDWPMRIIEAFEKYHIIQVFKYAHFLGPDNCILETHFSFTYALAHDIPIDKRHYALFYPHPGYGWGISRHAYDKVGKLIDFGILGSGDSHMAFALIKQVENSFAYKAHEFHPNYMTSLIEWEEKAYSFTLNRQVGYADCSIKHHFHGFREDRRYVERMKILINQNFDPINDLYYDENGLIQLKQEKVAFIKEIYQYFQVRNEDKVFSKDDLLRKSMQIPKKTIEEILKNADKLKILVEREKLSNALKNIALLNNHTNDINSMKKKKKTIIKLYKF